MTRIREHVTAGDFSFATLDGKQRGAVLGTKLAERLNVVPGVDSIRVFTLADKPDPVTGLPMPSMQTFEVTGIFDTGMYEYDNQYVIDLARRGARARSPWPGRDGPRGANADARDAPEVALALADSLGMPYRVDRLASTEQLAVQRAEAREARR